MTTRSPKSARPIKRTIRDTVWTHFFARTNGARRGGTYVDNRGQIAETIAGGSHGGIVRMLIQLIACAVCTLSNVPSAITTKGGRCKKQNVIHLTSSYQRHQN